MLQAWSSTTVSLIFLNFRLRSGSYRRWGITPTLPGHSSECVHLRLAELHGLTQHLKVFMQDFQWGQVYVKARWVFLSMENLHHVASLSRSPFQTCFLCCWMESVPCFPITMDLKHLQVYCFYCPGLLCGPPECLSWLKHSFQAV